MGEVMRPSINPNLCHSILRKDNALGLINESSKKITAIINAQRFISLELVIGYKAKSKKTIAKTMPKDFSDP